MSHFPPKQQHLAAGQDDKDIHNLTFDPSLSEAGTLPALRTPAHQELLAILSNELYGQPRQQQLNGGNRIGNSEDCSVTQDNNIYSYQNNSEISFHHQRNQHRTNDYYCNPDGIEEDGLVSPLRRPHINEIPPDLLAFMLKSPKFEEILAHPHLQQQIQSSISNSQTNRGSEREVAQNTTNPNSRNTYGDAINVVNVSTSHIRTSTQQSNQTKTQTRNQTPRSPPQPQPVADNAPKLSPMAKEFVPSMQNPDNSDLAMAFAQVQASMQNSFPNENQSSSSSQNDLDISTDCVLSTVTDTIRQLTINPPDFQRCAKITADVLKKYLTDVDILGIVVTLLVEQSINNSNFCYSGARLCQVLHKNEIKTTESTFKNALISRCQEEFQSCLKNVATKTDAARTQGFLMFLGELYMNFHIEQGGKTVPITIFGLAAIELMSKLVNASPTYDNIKYIFQLLKLLGWEFENAADARLKSEMEKFVKDLSYLLACKKVPDDTLKLVDALFALKRKNWNRSEEVYTESRANPIPYQNKSYSPHSETQYFELPDEVDDDDDFEGGNILLDDEPEDVGEAYEAFLLELENRR